MGGPFIFIGTHRIKAGRLDEYRKTWPALIENVEANEPDLIAFHIYADEEANVVTGVQVHPDAASMEFHMKVVGEHIREAYDYIEATESIQLFGEPSAALEEGLRQAAPEGTPVRIMRTHQAGFTRAGPAGSARS